MSEKESLYKFLNQIGGILNKHFTLNNFSSEVIEFGSFEANHHFSFLSFNHELTCVFAFDQNSDDVASYLKNLLQKEIIKFNYSGKSYLSWGEGNIVKNEPTPQNTESSVPVNTPEISDIIKNIEACKTSTRLPSWLDKVIFDTLKGIYAPDHERFTQNINLSDEELLIYLGTYFPRSFAESFCIFDDLFKNKQYYKTHSNKSVFNILDIGTGSGGNIIGLVLAMQKNSFKIDCLNIYAQDGHLKALESFVFIMESLKINTGININLKINHCVISSKDHLSSFLKSLPKENFNFISSFKMISEVIAQDISGNHNFYKKAASIFLPLLFDTGILLILDVTIKAPNEIYYPFIMNEGLRHLVNSSDLFKTLSPISCYLYGSKCNNECFCQQQFRVSHSRKAKDLSKVTYRIIGHKSFVDEILNIKKNKGKFVTVWRNSGNTKFAERYCIHSLNEKEIIDSYKLS